MPRKPPSTAKSGKKTAAKAGFARPGAKSGKARPAPAKGTKPVAKAAKPVPKAAEPAKKAAGKTAAKAATPAVKPTPATILAVKALKRMRAAKKAATPKPAPRLKIVWAVCDHTLKTLKTFPYPERRAAEIEATRLVKSKGKEHVVRAERVPMTAPPEARK